MTPGDRVGANLELLRPAASGGMGAVWVARHHGLETEVAIKVLHADVALNPAAVERFRREAALAANVKSPHIVQQLDVGVTELGAPYIVMELLNGEDLQVRLEREHTLAPADMGEIVRHTSRALEAAHAAGVIHRDIKPGNLFLVENAGAIFVKVLDFGIAKTIEPLASALTQEGMSIGTPAYMSPEQLFAKPDIDGRSDLWSLAAVAYEGLTGSVPFAGDSLAALGVSISLGAVPRPSVRAPSLGTAYDAWFMRAFAQNPADRFPNARAFADAFDAACTQMSAQPAAVAAVAFRDQPTRETAAFATTTLASPRAAKQRKTVIVAAAAAAAVALVGIGAFAISGASDKADPAAASASALAPAQSASALGSVQSTSASTAGAGLPGSLELPAIFGGNREPQASASSTLGGASPAAPPKPTANPKKARPRVGGGGGVAF